MRLALCWRSEAGRMSARGTNCLCLTHQPKAPKATSNLNRSENGGSANAPARTTHRTPSTPLIYPLYTPSIPRIHPPRCLKMAVLLNAPPKTRYCTPSIPLRYPLCTRNTPPTCLKMAVVLNAPPKTRYCTPSIPLRYPLYTPNTPLKMSDNGGFV